MERFTISIDDHLAQEFDSWIAQRGYANRSEAFRDMVRSEMERNRVRTAPAGPCVACLSYVYNHHERDLGERLTRLQHAHHDLTLSTMHAHLDHEHCIETVLLKGPASAVQRFADALCAEKGVLHGKLNLIGVDEHAHPCHDAGASGILTSSRLPEDTVQRCGQAEFGCYADGRMGPWGSCAYDEFLIRHTSI